jgi:hypothetical protein
LEKRVAGFMKDGNAVRDGPRRPYDGHTLGTIIPEIEQRVGVSLKRILCDAGYKGHSARRTSLSIPLARSAG